MHQVRRKLRGVAFCAGILFFAVCSTAAHLQRPNIIFILSDDQGWSDLGCYGSHDLLTPSVDALAARGIRFTRFYAAAPVCSPSRAALLTGRYPTRVGLTGNAASQKGDKAGLAPEETTLAEIFKRAGYMTAHMGKWHLGYTPDSQPNAQGFDTSFGHMGGCIDNYSHFFYWSGPNVHDLYRDGKEVFRNGEFFPELMLLEAFKFIEENRERPFFLYYALNTPHYPYQGEGKWLERFASLPYPRNLYAAFLASQDERIGKLLAKVDALGLRERTIIIFQSDNGHSTEERAHFGGGSAGEYRGAKFSLFEGGIRVPAIVSWPGRIPEGVVSEEIAHGTDWLPTLAELSGVSLPPIKIDGRSLAPVLKKNPEGLPHRVLHWQTGTGKDAQWAVRDGPWKLIANAWDTSANDRGNTRIPFFLVNLASDPNERTNLIEQHNDIVARLTELHEHHLTAN